MIKHVLKRVNIYQHVLTLFNTRYHLGGCGQHLGKNPPTSLPKLPIQLKDLSNNQNSLIINCLCCTIIQNNSFVFNDIPLFPLPAFKCNLLFPLLSYMKGFIYCSTQAFSTFGAYGKAYGKITGTRKQR